MKLIKCIWSFVILLRFYIPPVVWWLPDLYVSSFKIYFSLSVYTWMFYQVSDLIFQNQIHTYFPSSSYFPICQFPRLRIPRLSLISTTLLCPASSYLPDFVCSTLDSTSQDLILHHWSSVWLIFLFHSILLFRTFQRLTMIYRTKNRCLSLVFRSF